MCGGCLIHGLLGLQMLAGQCHQSDQHEFDQTPGGSGRQEGLACAGPWGHEELDTTKQINDNWSVKQTNVQVSVVKGSSYMTTY